jgi:predicted amidohydrolase YtcJ
VGRSVVRRRDSGQRATRPGGWKGDAQAIGVRGTRIVFVGSNENAMGVARRGRRG